MIRLRKNCVGRFLLATLFLFMAFAAFPSHAFVWDIYYPSSKLIFEGNATGTPFTGTFSVFQAAVDFDPKKPDNARIEVNIDVRSAKTGDKEKDDYLSAKEWFDSGAIPFAQLIGTKVRKLSDKKFELTGLLTIKEVTQEIVLPFSMEDERDAQRIKGQVTINRLNYHIGSGSYANEAYVKKEVTIKIDLLAIPKK